jgi:hypothetical protein
MPTRVDGDMLMDSSTRYTTDTESLHGMPDEASRLVTLGRIERGTAVFDALPAPPSMAVMCTLQAKESQHGSAWTVCLLGPATA